MVMVKSSRESDEVVLSFVRYSPYLVYFGVDEVLSTSIYSFLERHSLRMKESIYYKGLIVRLDT